MKVLMIAAVIAGMSGAAGAAELQLPYNGWDFQAIAPDVSIYEAHPSWHHTFRQEVAVSVNGAWLTDRVSGTPSFSSS